MKKKITIKQVLAFILVMVICLSVASCTTNGKDTTSTTIPTTSSTTTDNGENPPPQQETGTFGSFDEVNTKTSYLGYGIDIINSPAITSKNLLMNYPIFDMDKLMDETLLKDNSTKRTFEVIESETIEGFLESMSRSTSVTSGASLSASGKIDNVNIGGSISCTNGIKTTFTKTDESVSSQYFLEIIAEDQSYWLILQTTESRYKEILSEEFKRDLYNPDVTPAQLFGKYGTHLLTSVAMGGNICMYYTMYSYSETTSKEKYVDLSREINKNINASYDSTSAGGESDLSYTQAYTYLQKAEEYNILVDKKIIAEGGNFNGIGSEKSLYEHYDEWQASLEEYPVLIGIKDNNSLYPIWNLLDLDVEGASERYNELYAYFQSYGIESYNELLKLYSLDSVISPEEITNINVGKVKDYQSGQVVQVKPGEVIDISFDVLPKKASNYVKTYSVDDRSKASINHTGILTVSNDAKVGDNIIVTVTAGDVSAEISLMVIERIEITENDIVSQITYNLNDTIKGEVKIGSDDDNIAVKNKTKSLKNALVDTYDSYYVFDGWYTSAEGGIQIADGNGHLLANVTGYTDSNAVWICESNVELYAHWKQAPGKEEYIYIETPDELKTYLNSGMSDGKYMLIKDIDLNGNEWIPVPDFSGELDGNGNSIYNFYIIQTNQKGSANIGFICNNTGTIKNLTIGSFDCRKFQSQYSVSYMVDYIESKSKSLVYVGGLVGKNQGTITDCMFINGYINAVLKDNNNNEDLYLGVGGICGINCKEIILCSVENCTLDTNCRRAVDDSGDDSHGYVGGIAAWNKTGLIQNCNSANNTLDLEVRADGKLGNKANAYGRMGGIVGIQTDESKVITCTVGTEDNNKNTFIHVLSKGLYTDNDLDKGNIVGKNEDNSQVVK